MIRWLIDNWLHIATPVVVFLAILIVGVWLRRIAYSWFDRWIARTKWEGSRLVARALRRPLVVWFLLLGAGIAIGISVLPPEAKSIAGKGVGSLFILSLGWVSIVLSDQLIRLYLQKTAASSQAANMAINAIRIAVSLVGALIVLDIWGVPTAPLILLIVGAVVAAALVFRDAVPNLFAGLQISTTHQIKVGDYIKVETGEEGYVTEIHWGNTRIKASDESTILVPNSRLLRHTVTNYGRPVKRARETFHFYSRAHLKELTGLTAKSLPELVNIMKTVPDAAIYYHTHHFLEEHHYLTPEPSNDFAVWVNDVLGDEVLGERLASVDIPEFATLGSLRDRLIGIIQEYLSSGLILREAMAGREFHFVKSVSVIFPTPYVAHDLRECVEALRKISLGSLYFHIFESRLQMAKGLNDFSLWMRDSLDERELADEIARIDPYTYTLEVLRSSLIQLIEKRIKQESPTMSL